jgi:hypothetical protein
MDTSPIVDALQADNPLHPRDLLIYLADQLAVWWVARADVRARGQITQDGKPNPSMKIVRETAGVIWSKRHEGIIKDGAIKYLEENHGVAKRDGEEASGGGGSPPVESDPPDLCTGGVEEAMDRGVAVVRGDLGTVPRKGRKPGVSKLPAHLRP